ncbi:BZ3500_MvSof-1268-A1-R1_Chr8-1g09779 [Microbotryum saponariae]|uniref:triacylglycerol lipase n=1 Tax=Microbotryum saponariae TaxID=289078 RepID=A0A2X0MFH2_9BASI|nr:BZ3500_MvSof-1268-A1-R1_Chr8-1g09779 [Microbotryum saponariae]SDA08065.1 BZ3501_MvSof-1269-A2-R1_Chr8-1g09502 [Microbotryum saponariae]
MIKQPEATATESNVHPHTRFNQIATAQGKAAIAKAQSQCATADFGSFAGVSLLTTNFTSLGPNLLKDPIVAKYMNMGNLATNPKETPTRPQLYMFCGTRDPVVCSKYHNLHTTGSRVPQFHTSTDETVPYGPALKTAQTWCDEGARIEFTTRNGGRTHAQTQALYSPQAIAWLDSTLKDSHVVVRQCAFLTKGLAV